MSLSSKWGWLLAFDEAFDFFAQDEEHDLKVLCTCEHCCRVTRIAQCQAKSRNVARTLNAHELVVVQIGFVCEVQKRVRQLVRSVDVEADFIEEPTASLRECIRDSSCDACKWLLVSGHVYYVLKMDLAPSYKRLDV